jgi:VWFA-related protein
VLLYGLALQGEPRRVVALQRIDVTGLPIVDVYLTVSDSAGKSVLGLTEREVEVAIDGTPQPGTSLISAIAGGEHLAVVLLFDRSGSMKQALDVTREAASGFVRRLSVGDRLAVVSFDEQIRVDAPLTSDRVALEAAVRGITAGSNTVLYDAVHSALGLLENAGTRRQAILVLSDGKDTRSRLKPADVVADVKAKGVPVYTIGLGSGVDAATLTHLAEETGGTFLRAAGPEDLRLLYQSIADLLENQYRLSFSSTFGVDEAWHALTVTVRDAGGEQTSAPREFVSSRGPGVSPGVMRAHEEAAILRARTVNAAVGSTFGLVAGLILMLGVRFARPDAPLVSVAAVAVLLLAAALGAVAAVLVPEIVP